MALSKTTRDHDQIRKWAEARGAVPAEVAGTERSGEPGILRFEFPKAPRHNDSQLSQISWDDFFAKFDERNLELVYQEKTAGGAQSNFNKLVCPENDKVTHRRSSSGTAGTRTRSGSTSAKSKTKSHGTRTTSATRPSGSSGTGTRKAGSSRSASSRSTGSSARSKSAGTSKATSGTTTRRRRTA